jgi:hypothetical protein
MSNRIGLMACIALLCLTEVGVFFNAFNFVEFVALMVFGTAAGVYFVCRDYKGE